MALWLIILLSVAAAGALEGFCCREISREGKTVYFVLLGTTEPDPGLFPGVVLADDDDPITVFPQYPAVKALFDSARILIQH